MTNKPMLSVEPIKLVAILASELNEWPEGCDELFQTSSGRVIGISSADDEVSEKIGQFTMNSEGNDPHVTRAEFESAKAELTQKPAAQHQVELVVWVECSPAWLKAGGDCATAPRICVGREGISHLHPAHSNAEQPATVADHPQCEECKGWGYHENHHEGGGTECGECGGSGNASVAVFIPDVDELTQIIRKVADSHNLGAGSLAEAILEEVARLNGLKT